MGKSEDLLLLAENDLKIARLILNSANDELMQNSAAYHCQQAVEKILKALILQAGGEAGVTHNISELSKILDKFEIQYPTFVKEYDYDITSWATTIRYNANFKADHDLIQNVMDSASEWLNLIKKTK